MTTLFGLVASREARGYVVDVGVGGATGFLAFKHCDADISVGAPVECRVLKLDPDSGVCAFSGVWRPSPWWRGDGVSVV